MRFVFKKGCTLIITLLIVSLLAFLAFNLIPGDPVSKMLGTSATVEKAEALREELGLNRPVLLRYLSWLSAFIRGDYGRSYSYQMPVGDMIADKLPVTVLLTLFSFLITLLISLPLGILSGGSERWALDSLSLILDQICMAVPPFFLGILMVWVFGNVLRLFTPGSYVPLSESVPGCLSCLFLPSLAMAIPRSAMTVRMLRGSIQAEKKANYVLTAKSRGETKGQILRRHVLRNAMIPTVTFLAQSAAEIMTGTIIIEQVFGIPGIGRLLLSSIGNRDFPVVLSIVVLMAVWIVMVNFLADVINAALDPRVRENAS